MTVTSLLVLLLLGISSSSAAHPVALSLSAPTAYEVLVSYNFPMGLLPEGALGYDLDAATGRFTAYLSGNCRFSLRGSYDLSYSSKISGKISQNRLSNLKGISVRVLFLWLNIVEVTRVDDSLEFSVGLLSADFSVENFYECPKCGCGMDCVGDKGRVIKLRVPF